MEKVIRCPRCNKRLFDATEEARGPITVQCNCRYKVLVRFYSVNKILYKINKV